MYKTAKKKGSALTWGLMAVVVAMLGAGVYFVKAVLSDDDVRKKKPIAIVTLMKPPPPPQVKEKPLEQPKEIEQKEEIVDPVQQNEPTPQANDQDNTPAGDRLGLDAEGGAGSDAFGLIGKKGGRSLIAGEGGGMGKLSLLSKYAGYTHLMQAEIRKIVMKYLEEEGGIPKGKLQAVARVSVRSDGTIADCKIIGSSGNHTMDNTIRKALSQFKVSEPPPYGMPRTMDIRLTYQS